MVAAEVAVEEEVVVLPVLVRKAQVMAPVPKAQAMAPVPKVQDMDLGMAMASLDTVFLDMVHLDTESLDMEFQDTA